MERCYIMLRKLTVNAVAYLFLSVRFVIVTSASYLCYHAELCIFQAARLFLLVHGQVTIIFVVSVCLFVQSFSQPSSIRFGSN